MQWSTTIREDRIDPDCVGLSDGKILEMYYTYVSQYRSLGPALS